MRVGTWNLAGRWDARHRNLLESLNCDVLLLTEVPDDVGLEGYQVHLGCVPMMPARSWAAIASRRPLRPLPDPHGASAMAEVDGDRFCASVLPWRSCGSRLPWVGDTVAEATAVAVARVEDAAPAIWGGDWNHALHGKEYAGSHAGRQSILKAVEGRGLQVPTADLPHQLEGLLSIDHIAVPGSSLVVRAERHRAIAEGRWLSDHDAYTVEVAAGGAAGVGP